MLFSSAELQTVGGLKAYGEWEQQEDQRSNRETLNAASGGQFTVEPRHFAWCEAYTPLALVKAANAQDEEAALMLRRQGGAQQDPVSGRWAPYYALCQRMNPDGACEKHEPL